MVVALMISWWDKSSAFDSRRVVRGPNTSSTKHYCLVFDRLQIQIRIKSGRFHGEHLILR